MSDKFVHHTRIAPSPTGMMHIGTARTALFSWLAARATGGRFIMRLDDTDLERNQPEAIQPIYDGLAWLGLNYDEQYRQSERGAVYEKAAQALLESGYAEKAENGALLLRPRNLHRSWRDELVGELPITDRDMEMIDGLVLVRGGDKLGQPLYHFTSIVDDYEMGITSIIRGDDHRSNTAKQIAIWWCLNRSGFLENKDKPLPRFYHVGLIFKDKKKMSKRDGAASLLDYRDKGYDPDAIFNFLLRLGWGPRKDDKSTAMINRDQALQLFLDGGSMSARPSNFDGVKLDSFNRKYAAQKKASSQAA
jgi:glutamyl/glutaminyl-tRNA synthetase